MKKYFSFLITLMLASVAYADMTWVADGHKNVIAKRLAGTWQGDDLITEKLIGPPPDRERVSETRMTFTEDHDVFNVLKKTVLAKIKTIPVLCTGRLGIEVNGVFGGEALYALVEIDHNPVFAWYVNDDLEFQHVALAQGLSAEKDILFLGGDKIREPMVAFSRVK